MTELPPSSGTNRPVGGPLAQFVASVERACEMRGLGEAEMIAEVTEAMQKLVSRDDWLPPMLAACDPSRYQQFLLHLDDRSRFSVVSFVWGPGQRTPIHDHTVWGVIGMLRGAELSQSYVRLEGGMRADGAPIRLEPGCVVAVSPTIGDIHQVSNAFDDRVSISIHCYGGDIGSINRHVFSAETGEIKEFVSGYSPVVEH